MQNFLEVHRRLCSKLPQKLIIIASIFHPLQSQSTLQLVFTNTHWVRITESLPNQNTWMHNQFPPGRDRTNQAQQTDVRSPNPAQGRRVQTLSRAEQLQNLYSQEPKCFPAEQNSGLLQLLSIIFFCLLQLASLLSPLNKKIWLSSQSWTTFILTCFLESILQQNTARQWYLTM